MFSIVNQLINLGQRSALSTRRCTVCNDYKPLAEFSIKDKAKGWLDTRCKPCKSEHVQKCQEKRKEAQSNNPDFRHFMTVFESVYTPRIIRAIYEHSGRTINLTQKSKRAMAQIWADSAKKSSKYKGLRNLDLEKVKETAVSY